MSRCSHFTRAFFLNSVPDQDDNIAHFVAGIGIAVSFDDVAEREGAADDGTKMADFDERLEELEVGLHGSGGAGHEDRPATKVHPEAIQQRRDNRGHAVRETDEEIASPSLQRAEAAGKPRVGHDVANHVVRLAVACEVARRVVDDLVGAQRPHELDVRRTANRCYTSAVMFRELDRKGPETARRPMNEHALAGPDARLPEKVQRTTRTDEQGRRVLEGHVGGLVREETVLDDACELGVRAELVAPRPEDQIAEGKSRHVLPDRGHGAGEIDAEYPGLRPANAVHEPHDRRTTADHPVAVADRRGAHTHEHLVVARDGRRYVLDLDDFRGPIASNDGGFHAKGDTGRLRCRFRRVADGKVVSNDCDVTWPARLLLLCAAIVLSGCGAKTAKVATPAGPDVADELVQAGCYDCLLDARMEYERRAITSPAAVPRLFEVTLLLALREKELAIDPRMMLERAAALAPKLPGFPAERLLSVVRTLPPDATARRVLPPGAVVQEELKAAIAALDASPFSSLFKSYLALSIQCGRLAVDGLTQSPVGDPPLLMYRRAICQNPIRVDPLREVRKSLPRFVEASFFLGRAAMANTNGAERARA